MKTDKKQFSKMFPHLAKELEGVENKVAITSVRSDTPTGEKASSKKFAGFMPDVIDFIRRCDSK